MSYMKKSVLIVLLVLVLLFGCAVKKTTKEQQPTFFRSGSQGLFLSFIPNLPPPKLFDRDPFNVMIQVENKGTSPVGGPGDRLYLSGFDNSIITGINTYGEQIPPMDGRGPYMPQGGLETVNFRGVIQSLTGKRIDKYQPMILVTACYNYETIDSEQVCIDPNPYAPTSVQKVCTPMHVGTGSQGAPIAVTGVDVDAAPGKTRFTITIRNVGGGDAFKMGGQYLDKCSPYNPGLGFDEVDYVQLADVSISGISIRPSCKPVDPSTGHIRLSNGGATLFCEYEEPMGQSPYLTPLNIILHYGYRQSIAKQVEIRPIS